MECSSAESHNIKDMELCVSLCHATKNSCDPCPNVLGSRMLDHVISGIGPPRPQVFLSRRRRSPFGLDQYLIRQKLA